MRLYRTTVKSHPDVQGPRPHWVGSQAEASKYRASLTSSGVKRADITTDEIDVPTDKRGLLEWLNNHG